MARDAWQSMRWWTTVDRFVPRDDRTKGIGGTKCYDMTKGDDRTKCYDMTKGDDMTKGVDPDPVIASEAWQSML
jgi:hypothetical protein